MKGLFVVIGTVVSVAAAVSVSRADKWTFDCGPRGQVTVSERGEGEYNVQWAGKPQVRVSAVNPHWYVVDSDRNKLGLVLELPDRGYTVQAGGKLAMFVVLEQRCGQLAPAAEVARRAAAFLKYLDEADRAGQRRRNAL